MSRCIWSLFLCVNNMLLNFVNLIHFVRWNSNIQILQLMARKGMSCKTFMTCYSKVSQELRTLRFWFSFKNSKIKFYLGNALLISRIIYRDFMGAVFKKYVQHLNSSFSKINVNALIAKWARYDSLSRFLFSMYFFIFFEKGSASFVLRHLQFSTSG